MVIDKSATFRFVQLTMFYVDILSVAPDRPGVATGPRGCSALFYTFLHCTPESVLGEGANDTNAEVLMASDH